MQQTGNNTSSSGERRRKRKQQRQKQRPVHPATASPMITEMLSPQESYKIVHRVEAADKFLYHLD
jgi:hypothetical protein